MNKEDGGLGFRSFNYFNLAMIAKHGWRFIANPNVFISHFFKVKYFPNRDFLRLIWGSKPSCIWCGICYSKVVLRKGLSWKIGDGVEQVFEWLIRLLS